MPNPTGSVRCANRLSCRFVDARYNLPPPHCSQVSMEMLKTRLSLCAFVPNGLPSTGAFVPVFFPALSARLV
jgi:hypothetical protein